MAAAGENLQQYENQKTQQMTATGNIYLIPNVIAGDDIDSSIPQGVLTVLRKLRHFIVEDLRTARRYLRKAGYTSDFDSDTTFFVLNKHTAPEDISGFLAPALAGNDMGIISESGVPCVADPGNAVVEIAQQKNIRVIPLVGPSSILLALMASGFNGQNFAFNGYLPIKDNEKAKKLKELENKIIKENQTQIFIEAPYRNQKLLEFIVKTCNPQLKLCIARNITAGDEYIKTKTLAQWKHKLPQVNKINTIFLLYK
jgi:16S rRNA (cytidine1402-2'-O)-methyltransferase